MKKQIILSIVFTLALTSAAFSQIKQISSSEFYTASSTADKLMYENSRRVVIKTETLENGAVTSSVTKTDERLLPDKRRYLTVEKKDGKETSLEFIYIGTIEYRRENGGQWTKKDLRGMGMGSGTGSGSASVVQFTEESDFVEGVPARKLKELRVTQSSAGLMSDEFTAWYDERGFLVRSEGVKGNLEPRTVKVRSVATYEYNPSNLKIEAPIK